MEVHISRREDLIQSDILEEVLHKEEKKQLLEAVSQLKGQKKGSDPITVFWGLFTEGDCGDA